jgi:hypothetical protein
MVAESVSIKNEAYLSILIDSASNGPVNKNKIFLLIENFFINKKGYCCLSSRWSRY